jgi:hypothetical protein
MRVVFITVAALLVMSTASGSLSAGATLASTIQLGSLQAQQADFTRPDVAPLQPDGKFQVMSDTPWPGDKVRVFFLGAQF